MIPFKMLRLSFLFVVLTWSEDSRLLAQTVKPYVGTQLYKDEENKFTAIVIDRQLGYAGTYETEEFIYAVRHNYFDPLFNDIAEDFSGELDLYLDKFSVETGKYVESLTYKLEREEDTPSQFKVEVIGDELRLFYVRNSPKGFATYCYKAYDVDKNEFGKEVKLHKRVFENSVSFSYTLNVSEDHSVFQIIFKELTRYKGLRSENLDYRYDSHVDVLVFDVEDTELSNITERHDANVDRKGEQIKYSGINNDGTFWIIRQYSKIGEPSYFYMKEALNTISTLETYSVEGQLTKETLFPKYEGEAPQDIFVTSEDGLVSVIITEEEMLKHKEAGVVYGTKGAYFFSFNKSGDLNGSPNYIDYSTGEIRKLDKNSNQAERKRPVLDRFQIQDVRHLQDGSSLIIMTKTGGVINGLEFRDQTHTILSCIWILIDSNGKVKTAQEYNASSLPGTTGYPISIIECDDKLLFVYNKTLTRKKDQTIVLTIESSGKMTSRPVEFKTESNSDQSLMVIPAKVKLVGENQLWFPIRDSKRHFILSTVDLRQ